MDKYIVWNGIFILYKMTNNTIVFIDKSFSYSKIIRMIQCIIRRRQENGRDI